MSQIVKITATGYDLPIQNAAPGEAVLWWNTDNLSHSATADNGQFETGELKPGDSKQIIMGTTKGNVRYHDRYGPHFGFINIE